MGGWGLAVYPLDHDLAGSIHPHGRAAEFARKKPRESKASGSAPSPPVPDISTVPRPAGWAAPTATDTWRTPARRMRVAVGKQAVPSPETWSQKPRGGTELSPLGSWLALLPTYRPLRRSEEKEADDYDESTEGTAEEEPASLSCAWTVDPPGGRGRRGGGRAPVVERFELPLRMAIYSSFAVPDEHPGR